MDIVTWVLFSTIICHDLYTCGQSAILAARSGFREHTRILFSSGSQSKQRSCKDGFTDIFFVRTSPFGLSCILTLGSKSRLRVEHPHIFARNLMLACTILTFGLAWRTWYKIGLSRLQRCHVKLKTFRKCRLEHEIDFYKDQEASL